MRVWGAWLGVWLVCLLPCLGFSMRARTCCKYRCDDSQCPAWCGDQHDCVLRSVLHWCLTCVFVFTYYVHAIFPIVQLWQFYAN